MAWIRSSQMCESDNFVFVILMVIKTSLQSSAHILGHHNNVRVIMTILNFSLYTFIFMAILSNIVETCIPMYCAYMDLHMI